MFIVDKPGAGRSLWWVQVVCLVAFVTSIIAVPLLLRTKPSLPYGMLNTTASWGTDQMPVMYEKYRIVPYLLLELFMLPSLLEHGFAVLCWNWYLSFLVGVGWHRWAGYAVSAPTMMAVVLYAVGLGEEIYSSLMSAGLIAACILTGPLVEHGAMKRDWFVVAMSFVIGFLTLTFAFIPVWVYFNVYAGRAPAFVQGIVAVITLLYWSFGFVPIISILRGETAPYYFREKFYCILSLCAKMPLVWMYTAMFLERY